MAEQSERWTCNPARGPKFKSCPDREQDLFLVVPSSNFRTCLNNQLVHFLLIVAGGSTFNLFMLHLNYLFHYPWKPRKDRSPTVMLKAPL